MGFGSSILTLRDKQDLQDHNLIICENVLVSYEAAMGMVSSVHVLTCMLPFRCCSMSLFFFNLLSTGFFIFICIFEYYFLDSKQLSNTLTKHACTESSSPFSCSGITTFTCRRHRRASTKWQPPCLHGGSAGHV